jgi:drug/metabolite transporter (DMT)-like permease
MGYQVKRSAQFFIILAAICWGMIGIFTRQLTAAGLSFIEITSARSIIVTVCLFTFLFISKKREIRIKIKDSWVFICMGGFGIVLNNICYFNTIELMTLSAASIVIYTAPYMVMIMSALLFKERITLQKSSALLIAFIGCVMTVGLIDSNDISIMGIMTGLGSAFGYALYSIFGRIALRRYNPLTVTAYTFAVASIMLIPFSDVGKVIMLMYENTVTMRNVLILGVCLTVIPFVSYTKGLKDIEASKASIIAFIEPLTAAASGITIYGEMLSPIKILGMVFIFISLVILNLSKKNISANWAGIKYGKYIGVKFRRNKSKESQE